jgi:hypothetical protein
LTEAFERIIITSGLIEVGDDADQNANIQWLDDGRVKFASKEDEGFFREYYKIITDW